MTEVLKVEGRKTPILNPNTDLGVILTAIYQDRRYELFKVTAAVGEKGADKPEDPLALCWPDTKHNGAFLGQVLSRRPDTGLVLHFHPEDGKYTPGGLNGIIIATEAGKEKYFAIGITRYVGDKKVPESYDFKKKVGLQVEHSALEAIKDIPNQLRS